MKRFFFGTNNVDADFGRLEYSIDLARSCGLTKEDMWFPSMSTRASRPDMPETCWDSEAPAS